jgi:hypothetical protein
MKNKTELSIFTIGFFAFAILYSLLLSGKLNFVPGYFTPNQIVIYDTIITPVPKQGLDTIVDVNGKNALFIGDSHTANHNWGWQVIVCKKTGLRMNNTAVIGKHLPWMVNVAKTSVTSNFDYCFVAIGFLNIFNSAIKLLGNLEIRIPLYNCVHFKGIIPYDLSHKGLGKQG